MDSELDMMQQFALAAKMAKGILGCVKRSKENRMRQVVMPLYLLLLRPYPDTGSSAGLPRTMSTNWRRVSVESHQDDQDWSTCLVSRG